MPMQRGRVYLVRFADSFHLDMKTAKSGTKDPEFLYATGMYEADLYEDGIQWLGFTNWWSSSDAEDDLRETSFVIKDAISEYWDLTPGERGLDPKTDKQRGDEDEEDEDEGSQPQPRPPPTPIEEDVIPPEPEPEEEDNGLPPYIR